MKLRQAHIWLELVREAVRLQPPLLLGLGFEQLEGGGGAEQLASCCVTGNLYIESKQ